MKLKSVSYTEFENQGNAWVLDELEFNNTNLLVGKNAAGKSRILRLFYGLARLIGGAIQPATLSNGKWHARFFDEESSRRNFEYFLSIHDRKVVSEKLTEDGLVRLDRRSDGSATIRFEKQDQDIDVQMPVMNLAAQSRRDPIQHPFFEPLHKWSSSVKYLEFSKIENQVQSRFEGKITMDALQVVPLQNSLHLITRLGKEQFGRTFESAVIADMGRIGYSILSFGLMSEAGNAAHPILQAGAAQTLFIEERGIDMRIPQSSMSNGMLRALAALIFLHFTRLRKRRECLLIDDIGEGLDFDRSTKLLNILVEESEKGFITLVMTTNDRFAMNTVPLKYWSIIQRNEGRVQVFNQKTASKAFADFEEFGFNNFDFFSKGYYDKGVVADNS